MWPVTAALLLLAVQGADPSAEGMKALEAQKYDVAAECFRKALAADPKDYGAVFHLALANSMLGKESDAVEGYREVLRLKPGLYQAELNLGILLIRAKHASEALPYLEAAVQQKPQDARPRSYLSEALLETGDLEKARQSFQTTLELDPKSAVAELGLAHALVRADRLADAEPHYRRAAELDPNYKDALLELAERLEKAGCPADAIAIYEGFPESVAVREHLGQMLVEAGRAADAIPHLESAVKQSPTTANRVALAQAYRKNKELDKALPLMEQAVQASPADMDLRMAYGRELRDSRRFADAAREFARVTQARPQSVEAWNELASMLVSLENYPQAIAALDRVKALGGETVGHLYLRAIILDRVRDLQGALENYRKFLAGSDGKHPDEEFKAKHRARIIEKELSRK